MKSKIYICPTIELSNPICQTCLHSKYHEHEFGCDGVCGDKASICIDIIEYRRRKLNKLLKINSFSVPYGKEF